jgi:hypothetical protein
MKKRFCNHCETVIPEEDTFYRLMRATYSTAGGKVKLKGTVLFAPDMCETCYKKVVSFVQTLGPGKEE